MSRGPAEASQINQINEGRRLRASAHLLIRRRAVVALTIVTMTTETDRSVDETLNSDPDVTGIRVRINY